mmetsp:Transcript_50788/g.91230  ORF Transcript_50788/g.91230 Transcript_50788/m.91230 type:complete len:265 (+) Transcript_50788:52-846(+)
MTHCGSSGGYAEHVLKDMYGGSLPRAAKQLLQEHAKNRSSSAPAIGAQKRWLGSQGYEPKQRRHVELKVPRVGRGQAGVSQLPPTLPAASRRPLARILADTSNYNRKDEFVERGKDLSEEKRRHQDRCAYNFGGALPTSHAPPGMPQAGGDLAPRRRVTFHSLPASREGSPRGGVSGLTAEQEQMAADIIQSVKERQAALNVAEEALQGCADRAEGPGLSAERRRLVMKEMASASHQRTQLRSEINQNIKDLEKLMDCAPDEKT